MDTTALNIGYIKWLRLFGRTVALLAVVALCLTGASKKHGTPRVKRLSTRIPRRWSSCGQA